MRYPDGGGRWLLVAGRRWRRRAQLRELAAVLEAGPAAWGWDEDQCWTLARIAEVFLACTGLDLTLFCNPHH